MTCALLALPSAARATPRMSLTAAVPCSTCHVAPGGGGIRTELGFLSMNDSSALRWADIGVESQETNRFLLNRVWVGANARLLLARLGRPVLGDSEDGELVTELPPLRAVPMQLQPQVAVEVLRGVTVDASYDVGPNTYQGELCSPVYSGQSCFTAAVQLDMGPPAPTVRAGVFQPNFGVRHDDHTVLTRANGANPRHPFIPPNYAEVGMEATWHPISSVQVVAGAFDTRRLREAIDFRHGIAELSTAYLAKATFAHTIEVGGGGAPVDAGLSSADEDFFADDATGENGDAAEPTAAARSMALHLQVGASFYGARTFHMENVYAGLGTDFGLAFLGEVAHIANVGAHHLNFVLMASYELFPWLVFAGRVERATPLAPDSPQYVAQGVLGVELFPIPFLELRPELRVVDTQDYVFVQPTLMIHLFY